MGYKKVKTNPPKPNPKKFSGPKKVKGGLKKSKGCQPSNPVNR
jgi:hypothetical protein